MFHKVLAALVISGVIVFSFFQFYQFLKKRIVTSDLKKVTERRIGDFLKAPVKVDRITVGFLKHISLNGLRIERTTKGLPLSVGVKKIVVRYDLFSLIKRNFKIPAEISLDSPRLTLQAFQSPFHIFETNLLKSDRGVVTRFEFEDGSFQMPLFGSEEMLSLSRIEGRAMPKKGDLFDVRFKAALAGSFKGNVLAYGEVNPVSKQYHLEINLDQVSSVEGSQLPISNLNGFLEIEQDTVRIRKMSFSFRGIACELSGQIQHLFSPKPVFELSLQIRQGVVPVIIRLNSDFEREKFSARLEFLNQTYQFEGSLVGLPLDFRIPAFKLNDRYEGSARFNSRGQIYWVETVYQNQRFRMDFSFKGLRSKLQFKLDHYSIFDFDLVTFATADVRPFDSEWQKGNLVFEANIQTEYLIFQYQPLRDFKATAVISLKGVRHILAQWGNVSQLTGEIGFVPSKAQLNLRFGPVAIDEFDYLGSHRLPSSLSGMLQGKMNVEGPLNRLYIDGMVTIADGKVGTLNYDSAVINFAGHLPYLRLNDSKIVKGKNTFGLAGGFDFSLQNFMRGIEVDNSEHIIIWRGLEMSSELEESGPFRTESQTLGRIQAEYELGSRTSLQATAEEDETKTEVGVGPKFKF